MLATEHDASSRDPAPEPLLPKGYAFDGRIACRDSEDCMGRPSRYWSATVRKHDGKVFIGNGETMASAMDRVIALAVADARFAALPPAERLASLLAAARKQGRVYDADLVEILHLLAERK